jgi:hypothetical protein
LGQACSETPKGKAKLTGFREKKENKWYWCGKPGHFKQECSEGRKENIVPLLTFEEE